MVIFHCYVKLPEGIDDFPIETSMNRVDLQLESARTPYIAPVDIIPWKDHHYDCAMEKDDDGIVIIIMICGMDK